MNKKLNSKLEHKIDNRGHNYILLFSKKKQLVKEPKKNTGYNFLQSEND